MNKPFRLAFVTVLLSAASALPAQTTANADWPSFIGDGSRVPAKQGYDLVDDLNAMRVTWRLKHHTTVGKGLYPSTLRASAAMGIEPFYGGAANPIVADGTVFVSYYKPDGKVPARPEGWRTVDKPEEFLPKWFFSVTADDILLAVDAETGKIRWEAVEKGVGLNRLAHKRAHWVRSPAWADGRVYSIGSVGVLRAYDAKSGNKLWERSTSPGLEKAREEAIKAGRLYWGADDQSSLVIADGVVIVARESLAGYAAADGKPLWQIDEPVMSQHGTPTLWRHDGRTYVLVHTGRSGQMRLVDPKTGAVLWTKTGLGPRLGTLAVSGDVVITTWSSQIGAEKDETPPLVRYGALRLTLKGAETLWVMDDKPENAFHWKHDKGPRYRTSIADGLAYLCIAPEGTRRLRLVVLDPQTGKVFSDQDMGTGGSFGNPIPMEDKLWVIHDYAHTDPITQSWWTAGKNPKRLNPEIGLPHRAITGYYIDMEPIYSKGRVYFRTLEGLICYDLRKPDPATSRTLQIELPAALTGLASPRTLSLYVVDGKVHHGGVSGSGRTHAVDASGLTLRDNRLSGEMKIGLEEATKPEPYKVDMRIDGDRVSGTITAVEEAFDSPVSRQGKVTAMQHQANWMPPATHVLNLEDAALNVARNPGRLLLFLTVRDGKLHLVQGWADQTTKARPAVYADDLKLVDGRLQGTVAVRYRPDEWTTPLVGKGTSAAATYDIDARLAGAGDLGRYSGTLGAKPERAVEVSGRVRKD